MALLEEVGLFNPVEVPFVLDGTFLSFTRVDILWSRFKSYVLPFKVSMDLSHSSASEAESDVDKESVSRAVGRDIT